MKSWQKIGIVAAFVTQGFGLEFGSMGQVSASMGGAGVALKNSAWGLYYNPALLGADRRTKIGYSFGATLKEQKLAQLAKVDIKNLQNLPDVLQSQLTGTTRNARIQIGGQDMTGPLGGMLEALFPNVQGGNIDDAAVSGLVNGLGGNCSSFSTCATEIQKNPDLANEVKDKVASAATDGGSPLLGQIIGSIDAGNIGSVLESLTKKDGNVADEILKAAGKITLSKGADSAIDKFLEDFGVIDSALKGNDMNVATQNGLIVQIGGDMGHKKVESDELGSIDIVDVDSGRGAVGFGVFASAFSSASAQIDSKNNRLIIEVVNGKDKQYYEVSANGDSITLSYLQNQTDLSGSIMNPNANHVLYANALALVEVPVGYGHTIFTPIGDVNVGIAMKFIQAIGYGERIGFNLNPNGGGMPSIDVSNNTDISQTFGLDLGLLYTPSFHKNLNFGLVFKNINAPTIKRTGVPNTILNRQLRAGVSYELLDFLTFAFDADLLPNDTLSLSSPQSQFVGGGVLASFKYVDFRLGSMYDFRSNAKEGMILTGGLNLFGFLDIAMQYGLGDNITINGVSLSNYMTLKVGGQFSF